MADRGTTSKTAIKFHGLKYYLGKIGGAKIERFARCARSLIMRFMHCIHGDAEIVIGGFPVSRVIDYIFA